MRADFYLRKPMVDSQWLYLRKSATKTLRSCSKLDNHFQMICQNKRSKVRMTKCHLKTSAILPFTCPISMERMVLSLKALAWILRLLSTTFYVQITLRKSEECRDLRGVCNITTGLISRPLTRGSRHRWRNIWKVMGLMSTSLLSSNAWAWTKTSVCIWDG